MHQKSTFWCYKTVYKPVFLPSETISVLDDACCIGYSLGFDQAYYVQSLDIYAKENQWPLIDFYAFENALSTPLINKPPFSNACIKISFDGGCQEIEVELGSARPMEDVIALFVQAFDGKELHQKDVSHRKC